MRERSVARVLGVLAAVALVAFVMPTSANHTQSDTGKSIVFDHKTGNQYWVEVVIGGTDASKVTKVEAQTGAPMASVWHVLEKKSWGAYAASWGIGQDINIRFRATFTDGTQAVSCYFQHPTGVERCTFPQPLGTWRSSAVGDVGNGFGNEAAVADVDFDDDSEVLVAADDGVFMFNKTPAGWQRTTVIEEEPFNYNMDVQDFELIAIGSTDRDDIPEVYTVGRYYNGDMTFDRLMWHHFNYFDRVWSSDVVWDFRGVSDILMADLNDDGKQELIAITDNGRQSIAYSVYREPGQFYFTEIARLANEDWSMGYAATADADRDLDDELYIQYNVYPFDTGILRVDWHGTAYVQDSIFQGHIDQERRGLAAGDGDNDGLDELYLLTSGFFPQDPTYLHRFSPRTDGWAHQVLPMGKGGQASLVLGDGNSDGFNELYAATAEGQLAQAMWVNSAWSMRAVHQFGNGDTLRSIVLGDVDGDGKGETYGIHYDGQPTTCCPPNYPVVHVSKLAPVGGGTTTTTTTSSTSTSGGAFDATFTGVRGNEWWVQASVSGNQAIAKVDVRLNGGAWQPVAKQSWGWGSSYHIVQGTTVQLRATSTSGATDLSSCYRWIPPSNTDATVVSCGGSTTTTTSSTTTTVTDPAFDAQFSGVKGNDWWVQVQVTGNYAVNGVDARVNCGSYHALTKQSWGGWAASFNIPAGSKVTFRATSSYGTDSSGGYVWPNATPTSGC